MFPDAVVKRCCALSSASAIFSRQIAPSRRWHELAMVRPFGDKLMEKVFPKDKQKLLLPTLENIAELQLPQSAVLRALHAQQVLRGLGYKMPLLQGAFVIVVAAGLAPYAGSSGSTISDRAEAAAIPWRLRQVSEVLGDPRQGRASLEDGVLLLVGGERVRVADVVDKQLRDCVLYRTMEDEMLLDVDIPELTGKELCLEVADMHQRGLLQPLALYQATTIVLREIKAQAVAACFERDFQEPLPPAEQAALDAAVRAALSLHGMTKTQLLAGMKFTPDPSAHDQLVQDGALAWQGFVERQLSLWAVRAAAGGPAAE